MRQTTYSYSPIPYTNSCFFFRHSPCASLSFSFSFSFLRHVIITILKKLKVEVHLSLSLSVPAWCSRRKVEISFAVASGCRLLNVVRGFHSRRRLYWKLFILAMCVCLRKRMRPIGIYFGPVTE